MLQAFVDESGRGDKEGVFVLAGFIAPVNVWADKFVPAWDELLKEETPKWGVLPAFKMSKMIRDLERAERFYRIIEDSVSAEVSCIVYTHELQKAYREFPWPFRLYNTQALTNPYYFGQKAIVDMLAQHQHMLGITEPVDFVFDNTSEKRNCDDAWDAVTAFSRPDVRQMMMGDPPIFRSDENVLPLQAADLSAYWVRKWEIEGKVDVDRTYPWKRNRPMMHLSFKFREQDFITEFSKVRDPEVLRRDHTSRG